MAHLLAKPCIVTSSQEKDDKEGLGGDAHPLLGLRGQLDVQKDDREAQDGEHDLEGMDDCRWEPQIN